MQQLEVKRLTFSKEADNWLRTLKARTGITPNLLCRVGFCLSLEEQGDPDPKKYPEDSDRQINRYTLLGQYDALFVALLKQRMQHSRDKGCTLEDAFRAHMNRGVMLLASRLKTLSDLSTVTQRVSKGQQPGTAARSG